MNWTISIHILLTMSIGFITENDDGQQFSLVVRDCVVDNGGTNSETEIGRQSHCGWMKVLQYNGERMRGCILSCDLDGCNTGQKLSAVSLWIFILLVVYLILQWKVLVIYLILHWITRLFHWSEPGEKTLRITNHWWRWNQ